MSKARHGKIVRMKKLKLRTQICVFLCPRYFIQSTAKKEDTWMLLGVMVQRGKRRRKHLFHRAFVSIWPKGKEQSVWLWQFVHHFPICSSWDREEEAEIWKMGKRERSQMKGEGRPERWRVRMNSSYLKERRNTCRNSVETKRDLSFNVVRGDGMSKKQFNLDTLMVYGCCRGGKGRHHVWLNLCQFWSQV